MVGRHRTRYFSLCLDLDKSGSIKQLIDPTLSHDRPPFNHHERELTIQPQNLAPIFYEGKSEEFDDLRECNSSLNLDKYTSEKYTLEKYTLEK